MDKQSKYWIGGAVVSALAVAASIGFSSPGSRLSAAEKTIQEHESRITRIDAKLDYIKEGVDRLNRRR